MVEGLVEGLVEGKEGVCVTAAGPTHWQATGRGGAPPLRGGLISLG